ncbi:hypothetical protein [Azospirillum argentinense]|uniref:GNAT family N-acetyltransferase n=1 Tax=Azospirillum brasilense TaxID=192 RepID=A0A4D8PZC2_AZOBR|nr:hypothetical protein [Azospirillum argentinense]QCO03397.1 hypothetical protein D3867_15085 [Azospirillum argentinense]
MARIKQGGIQNLLFLPIDATTDYLLASIGDQRVGAVRLHWKGAVVELEKNSVIGTGRGIRVLRKLFEGVKTEATARGCLEIRAFVREKHVRPWRRFGVINIGMEDDRDGAPAFLMQYRLTDSRR